MTALGNRYQIERSENNGRQVGKFDKMDKMTKFPIRKICRCVANRYTEGGGLSFGFRTTLVAHLIDEIPIISEIDRLPTQ